LNADVRTFFCCVFCLRGSVTVVRPDEYGVEESVTVEQAAPLSAFSPRNVFVPPVLAKWLRPHQREGVQFMYECVMGLKDYEGNGVILADDMGECFAHMLMLVDAKMKRAADLLFTRHIPLLTFVFVPTSTSSQDSVRHRFRHFKIFIVANLLIFASCHGSLSSRLQARRFSPSR